MEIKDINVLEIAKNNGYYTLLLLIISFIVQVYFTIKYPNEIILMNVIIAFITIAITYTYVIMVQGILSIAKEAENKDFIQRTKSFIEAIIICVVIAISISLVELLHNVFISLAVLILFFTSLIYLGVVSLRISKGFQDISERYGKYAKKAAFWHKVSGFLLISIIFSIIGFFTSLVADLYMWKLINKRLNEAKDLEI